MKAIGLAATAFMLPLSGCAAYPQSPVPTEERAPCPIISSRDWNAWVNAMPGLNPPRLIVTGKVTVPTGGYRFELERGPVQEIHPPVQQIVLRVTPPAEAAIQVVIEQEERGEFPALGSYGAVTIHCGGDVIATISDVQRAY